MEYSVMGRWSDQLSDNFIELLTAVTVIFMFIGEVFLPQWLSHGSHFCLHVSCSLLFPWFPLLYKNFHKSLGSLFRLVIFSHDFSGVFFFSFIC